MVDAQDGSWPAPICDDGAVRVDLRNEPQRRQAATAQRGLMVPIDPQNFRVYVIDDDPAVLDSTAFLLRAFGYECDTFADAENFLAEIQQLLPGCILSDLRMPGMNGRQLASALRARSIGWPMLLMTSDCGPEVQDCARADGFAAFLRKPLDGEALVEALDVARAALLRHDV